MTTRALSAALLLASIAGAARDERAAVAVESTDLFQYVQSRYAGVISPIGLPRTMARSLT